MDNRGLHFKAIAKRRQKRLPEARHLRTGVLAVHCRLEGKANPLGTGAAVVVILAAELLVGLVRRTTADLVPRAINLAAVTAAAWAGFQLLPATGQVPGLPDLLPGAAMLVGVWLVWLLFTKWQFRRNHG